MNLGIDIDFSAENVFLAQSIFSPLALHRSKEERASVSHHSIDRRFFTVHGTPLDFHELNNTSNSPELSSSKQGRIDKEQDGKYVENVYLFSCYQI